MIRYLSLAVVAVLLAGGCGEKRDSNDAVSPSPPFKPEATATAAAPVPRPAVDAGKDTKAESPQPGQANDHSSPDFKGGGTPDRK